MERNQKNVCTSCRGWAWALAGVVVTLGLMPVCGDARDKISTDALAQRLQVAEDRIEIQELVTSGYSWAIDTRDLKALASLFTEDGEFILLSKKFLPVSLKGRWAIEHLFSTPAQPAARPAAAPSQPPMDGFISMKHVITNPSVHVNGDQATSTSYWQEVAIEKDLRANVRNTGYYRDTLIRDQGRWRFKKREVFAYDMPSIGAQDAPTPSNVPATP